MKKWVFILAIAISLLRAQKEYPFNKGETLLYDVSLNFVSAGTASLELGDIEEFDGTPVYHITFRMKTNSVWDQIFRIRDTVETWIDSEGLFTRKLKKTIKEPRYSQKLLANFDYGSGVITTNKKALSISSEIRDPYSFFYYLRTVPLKVGDLFNFTIFDNHKLTDLSLIVHRKEQIDVPVGTFDCLVVEPFREGRMLFKNRGDMKVWLSDDSQRLPVKIVSKARFGSLIMKLSRHSP